MADSDPPALLDQPTPRPRSSSCTRCGRPLRAPASVAAGKGPVCQAKDAREVTDIVRRQLADLPPIPGVTVGPLEEINPYPPHLFQ